MNKELKRLICSFFPGENLKYALWADDYALAYDILIMAVDMFIEEFDARENGNKLRKAFLNNDFDDVRIIFAYCEKIYFLDIACNIVGFFADLKSPELEDREFACHKIQAFFTDLTAFHDSLHYEANDVLAFLSELFKWGKVFASMNQEYDEAMDDIDYTDVMGAFLDGEAFILAKRICQVVRKKNKKTRVKPSIEKKPQ